MTGRPVALVTGASSGIGLELARVAAARGHDLLLAARNESALASLAAELERDHGASARVVPVDLAAADGPDRLVAAVEALDWEIDVLVNNAGFGLYGDFLDTDLAVEREMIGVNVTALTVLAKTFARSMARRGRGRILNVASTAAFQPGPRMAVYYATKAYVLSLSIALAIELAPRGVTVTCLMPGATDTDFFARADMLDTRVGQAEKDDPLEVARAGFDAMMRGDGDVVTGWKNKLQAILANVTPAPLLAERHRKVTEPGSATD